MKKLFTITLLILLLIASSVIKSTSQGKKLDYEMLAANGLAIKSFEKIRNKVALDTPKPSTNYKGGVEIITKSYPSFMEEREGEGEIVITDTNKTTIYIPDRVANKIVNTIQHIRKKVTASTDIKGNRQSLIFPMPPPSTDEQCGGTTIYDCYLINPLEISILHKKIDTTYKPYWLNPITNQYTDDYMQSIN